MSEGATVTDADGAATPLFITESCSLHENPDILENDSQCISPSSLCQNAAFTRCRSENGCKPEQINLVRAEPINMRVAWKTSADAQMKFFAAKALGKRDYVTGGVWKNKPPFRLALNKAASDDTAWQCKHYTGRGVMKLHEFGAAFVETVGVPVSWMPGAIDRLLWKRPRIQMEGRTPRVQAVSHGMKTLARCVQGRSFLTMSCREPISLHSPTVLQSKWSPQFRGGEATPHGHVEGIHISDESRWRHELC